MTTEYLSRLRLLSWMSPSFPIGSYAYSHGLETAHERGQIPTPAAVQTWIEDLIRFGSARNDAILLRCAQDAVRHDRDEDLRETAEIAAILFGTPELEAESLGQGQAFWRTVREAWPSREAAHIDTLLPERGIAYPVAVGISAALHGIDAAEMCGAYLHAFVANGVSAAIRIGIMGHTDGQRVLSACEPSILAAVDATAKATLADLGSAAAVLDLVSLLHETQTTRLFRS